jgi:acyl dehydratase
MGVSLFIGHRSVAGAWDEAAPPTFPRSSCPLRSAPFPGKVQGRTVSDASGMNTTEIGTTARRTRTVTERDIALFTEITGDRNPIHYDDALARSSRFGGVVVQGGVTSGLLNALVAEQLPGPGSVFLEVGWHFRAPVRPGDVITAQATVTALRADKPLTWLAVQVTNQLGTTVLDGSAVVWRDPVVAAASNGAPHHSPEAGPSGVTTERNHP